MSFYSIFILCSVLLFSVTLAAPAYKDDNGKQFESDVKLLVQFFEKVGPLEPQVTKKYAYEIVKEILAGEYVEAIVVKQGRNLLKELSYERPQIKEFVDNVGIETLEKAIAETVKTVLGFFTGGINIELKNALGLGASFFSDVHLSNVPVNVVVVKRNREILQLLAKPNAIIQKLYALIGTDRFEYFIDQVVRTFDEAIFSFIDLDTVMRYAPDTLKDIYLGKSFDAAFIEHIKPALGEFIGKREALQKLVEIVGRDQFEKGFEENMKELGKILRASVSDGELKEIALAVLMGLFPGSGAATFIGHKLDEFKNTVSNAFGSFKNMLGFGRAETSETISNNHELFEKLAATNSGFKFIISMFGKDLVGEAFEAMMDVVDAAFPNGSGLTKETEFNIISEFFERIAKEFADLSRALENFRF